MYGGFQGGRQLEPPDAERRQSLGLLKSVGDVWASQVYSENYTVFTKRYSDLEIEIPFSEKNVLKM